MDNSGQVPLAVPGFNHVPLDFELPCSDRFTHGIKEYTQAPAVTARELAMTAAMNDITEIDDWYHMTDKNMAEWKTQMMAKYSLLSERTWAWCVSELEDKALAFQTQHFTRVLETGSCICKSDELIPRSTAQALVEYLPTATNDNIVDPFMYPLVYGKTCVLESGSVDPEDLYANVNRTVRSVRHSQFDVSLDTYARVTNIINDGVQWFSTHHLGLEEARELCWSSKFQALPCDVDIKEDVRITSYVNNLPVGPVYGSLEKIITASIGMWDGCLMRGRASSRWYFSQEQRGTLPLRIVTFGVEWHETLPRFARAFSEQHKREIELFKSGKRPHLTHLNNIPLIPELNDDLWHQAEEYLGPELPCDWREHVWRLLEEKADSRRFWTHPEPIITYDDWRSGRNIDQAVIKMISQPHHYDREPSPGPTHDRIPTRLRDYGGLQVIVKISSITARGRYESPWQVAGHLNEHIVASAFYIYQSDVRASVSFRQETFMPEQVYRCRGDRPIMDKSDTEYVYDSRVYYDDDMDAIAKVYGFPQSAMLHDTSTQYLPVQNIGTVRLPQGRLVTFPNTVEHRVEAEGEGQFRFVTLQLVDPNYRICSTRNVPPQQESWLDEAAELSERLKEQLKTSGKVFNEGMADAYKKQMLLEQEWITAARQASMIPFQF